MKVEGMKKKKQCGTEKFVHAFFCELIRREFWDFICEIVRIKSC